MSLKIIVNGALGRMGIMTATTIEKHREFELVAKLSKDDDLYGAIQKTKADIVIDFTLASTVYENTKAIITAGAHPVIGTTGLTHEQIQEFQKMCHDKKLGGVIAPNFSLGAVLMMKYASDAAKYLSQVEIIEFHHDGKEDAPSGTALRTAELISKNLSNKTFLKAKKENLPGSRGANAHNIPIHAVRLPGFVASQQVIFGNTGETLKISHDTINRECFMPGIVLACQKVTQLKELIVGLENIL
ncbi:MAG: 4-hydroxy-tetrahydrodipicolinate reductase [Proteobacteria bacterium]|nr:4-hydroxy-tetrahydrodipicolinate reductase [Pseudomonadota bacterium]